MKKHGRLCPKCQQVGNNYRDAVVPIFGLLELIATLCKAVELSDHGIDADGIAELGKQIEDAMNRLTIAEHVFLGVSLKNVPIPAPLIQSELLRLRLEFPVRAERDDDDEAE